MKEIAAPVMQIPHLDLFTVKVVTLVTVLVASFSTLLAWKVNRPVVGMRRFALGVLSMAVGSAVGISRLVIPGNAILILGNVLMVGGMVSTAQGIREFRGFSLFSPIATTVFAGIVATPFMYWMFIHDNFGERVAVISVAMCLLALDAASSMFRQVSPDDRLTFWPTSLAFGLSAVFLGVRAGAAFTGHYGSNFLTPVPIEIPLSLCADVAFVACAFGMLLASNTQLRNVAEKMAFFDPLTNLPNRRMLGERLLEAELRALQSGWQMGVIYLDLDGFKEINDTLGHEAGDQILQRVSAAMTPMLGPGDCLARVGGDEFVVLVEDLQGRSELAILAERLKSAVEAESISDKGTEKVHTSCGIAMFPFDGESAHDVMREADTAMYRAKRERRGAGHLAAM